MEEKGRSKDGKFQKGHNGFKPVGAQNKLRGEIKKFLSDEWPSFASWFQSLKAKEKIEVYLDLLPFAVGKLQNIAATNSEGEDIAPGAQIDYTKLSPSALQEILSATKNTSNEKE